VKQRVHEPLAETLQDPGAILLVSCYELGHQPLGLASPLGFLEREGFTPEVLDIAVERSPAGMDCQGSRKDVLAEIVRPAGIAFRPTWVAFTPWTTLEDYLDVLEFVEAEGLIDHVDAVQYAIRLLVPPGSALLTRPAVRPFLGSRPSLVHVSLDSPGSPYGSPP
jgi:hypothetical protein